MGAREEMQEALDTMRAERDAALERCEGLEERVAEVTRERDSARALADELGVRERARRAILDDLASDAKKLSKGLREALS